MSNPPTIDYGRPEPKRSTHVPTWLSILLIVASTVVLLAVLNPFPSQDRAREKANQVHCASNLRQIGQAMFLYAEDNHGSFPPDLATVVMAVPLNSEVLVCTSTPDLKATPDAPLSQPGHYSYLYVGAGLTNKSKPDCIVALEDPANHAMKGGNVLFADGHVEWTNVSTLIFWLNELKAGHNPPAQNPPAGYSDAKIRGDYEKNWKARMPQLKTNGWRIPTTQAATLPE